MSNRVNHGLMRNPRFAVLVVMIITAALTRLLPHPPNFAPIGAMALFGGAMFPRRRWAFLVPLVAMFASDLLLYGWRYAEYQPMAWKSLLFVYVGFALVVLLGMSLRSRRSVPRIAGTTLAGSAIFFLVTNFGTWFVSGTFALELIVYPKTLAGLIACYVNGLPFFHWTLLGDAVYVMVLFGAFALAESRLPALRLQPVLVDAD